MKWMIQRKIWLLLGFVLFLGLLTGAYFRVAEKNEGSGPVEVVFIQTQNDADCILLVQEGAAVLIDAGEKGDADHILEVLNDHGVEKLNYFILSHGDSDHIGGAAKVLSRIPADRVVEPHDTENSDVAALNKLLAAQGVSILYPTHNTRLRAGQMQMIVYPPLEKHYSDSNNSSLAVLVTHGEVNMLFPGDALRKRSLELEMVHWPQIDLYKVPHHGRANAETEVLFELLNPTYAVVTASDCDTIVKEAAQKRNTMLFYSVLEEIVFRSDGKQVIKLEREG